MAKRVMSVSTKGLDETLAMLQRLTDNQGFISLTLYEGAGFVADEMKKQIKALKVSKTAKKGEKRYCYQWEKDALLEGMGIASFDKSPDEITTKIGFDGYYDREFTESQKVRGHNYYAEDIIPIPKIANGINHGTSFEYKQPFKDRTYRASQKGAVDKMQSKLDSEIQKLTK